MEDVTQLKSLCLPRGSRFNALRQLFCVRVRLRCVYTPEYLCIYAGIFNLCVHFRVGTASNCADFTASWIYVDVDYSSC